LVFSFSSLSRSLAEEAHPPAVVEAEAAVEEAEVAVEVAVPLST
jgi:hypothetical protein